MEERLCFGTYINVLAQCKAVRVKKAQLVNAIAKTIDPNSKYTVGAKGNEKSADKDTPRYRALNHLYKCTGDFSPQYSSVIELAPKADRELVIQQFRENVIPLVDTDKSEAAVLALYAIIKSDTTLNTDGGMNVKKFQYCIGNRAIEDFLNASNYDLAEVLASIFLYTVTAVKNTEGKKRLEEISKSHEKYEDFFVDYVKDFAQQATDIKPKTSNKEPVINTKSNVKQMRKLFLNAVRKYKIMEIINRMPAILNRNDSAALNVFCRQMEGLIPRFNLDKTSPLKVMIDNFLEAVTIQALTLDSNLNIRFGPDDNTAFFNMEMDEEARKKDWKKHGRKLRKKARYIPELSIELIEESEDKLGMIRTGVRKWGNFRTEMNRLFEDICSWNDETID